MADKLVLVNLKSHQDANQKIQIKNAMSIAVELAAFNVDCNRMAAQNIIDASVCLQNFESMSDTNQTVVPAALSVLS